VVRPLDLRVEIAGSFPAAALSSVTLAKSFTDSASVTKYMVLQRKLRSIGTPCDTLACDTLAPCPPLCSSAGAWPKNRRSALPYGPNDSGSTLLLIHSVLATSVINH